MPIYRKNPDGSRTRVTYPNASGSATPASVRATVAAPAPPPTATILEPAPTRRRGHAIKNAQGKFLPTGEGVGFASPPKEHRFNGKPGPGRPKASLSHDAMVRKHLERKRKVRIDGKEKSVSLRELLIMTAHKQALEGKIKALTETLADSARLYPDLQSSSRNGGPPTLSAADRQLLDEHLSGLGLGEVPPSSSVEKPGEQP